MNHMIPEELKDVVRVSHTAEGLPADNNHDPSDILYYNGKYYMWYTQHMKGYPYGHFAFCKIMRVTSGDGVHWGDAADALLPSERGWDDGGVLTANVTEADGRYYMWYTGVGKGYSDAAPGTRSCGLAVADTPDGPFRRLGQEPVLTPGRPGSWNDEAVDDVSSVYFRGKWRAYFKGCCAAVQDADRTMLGYAEAEHIEGPYGEEHRGPLIRGHAFSIWPYKNGLLLLSGLKDRQDEGYIYRGDWNDSRGHQYLYYSEDGEHFAPCAEFPNRASGIFIPEKAAANRIENYWGVSVNTKNGHWERYIERFDFGIKGMRP